MAPIENPAVVHARSTQLALFIRGRLSNSQAERICAHILECGPCREELQDLTELLWPSLSIWIKCWLHLFSPSWPPSRIFRFVDRTTHRLKRSFQAG